MDDEHGNESPGQGNTQGSVPRNGAESDDGIQPHQKEDSKNGRGNVVGQADRSIDGRSDPQGDGGQPTILGSLWAGATPSPEDMAGFKAVDPTFPERIMFELGIKTLFVSNASGGMNPDFKIGDLMIITDHINFFPESPLRGRNFPTGPRFPDMHEPYDHELIALAEDIAKEKNIKVQHGIYLSDMGPAFETPAEYRMYRILGADAVGMSTVPEVIVACHCGIKVFGMSIITDLGGFDVPVAVSHEEVQKAANEAQPKMTEIMREMIRRS